MHPHPGDALVLVLHPCLRDASRSGLAKRVGRRESNPSPRVRLVWSGLIWRSRMLGRPLLYQFVKRQSSVLDTVLAN